MTDIKKMREAFERTNSRDHRRQPPKGNNYIDPMAQADWESFQKGWQASRAAAVVELQWDKHTVECRLEVSQDTLSTIRACLRAAESDIDQLKAENEALRKDAERYRWLRKPWQEQRQVKAWTSLEVMDENIDAAMAKEASHG